MTGQTTERINLKCTNYAILHVIRKDEWEERDGLTAGVTHISPNLTTREEVIKWLAKTKKEIKRRNKGTEMKFVTAIFPAKNNREEEKNYKTMLQIFLS